MDIVTQIRSRKLRLRKKLAIWAITPNGGRLAQKIAKEIPKSHIFVSKSLLPEDTAVKRIDNLAAEIKRQFPFYHSHLFIMATGIVVRLIKESIHSKLNDPAVAVMDDAGRFAISLLSGHIGGANLLCQIISGICGATPVITTATDVNALPAIDVTAMNYNLSIENPKAIRHISMSLICDEYVKLHDPYNILYGSAFQRHELVRMTEIKRGPTGPRNIDPAETLVFVDDRTLALHEKALVLRPKSLSVGIGCNRDTSFEEIYEHLLAVFRKNNLATESIANLSSIDIKSNESGLIKLSSVIKRPMRFYPKEVLSTVETIKNPSTVVEMHVGVKSVCEASAILAANHAALIVPKVSTKSVTIAIARRNFSSSGPAPEKAISYQKEPSLS